MLKKFNTTAQAEVLACVDDFLTALNISRKEHNRMSLTAEESLNILLEHSQPGEVKVYLRKILGTASIEFRVPGKPFTFAENFAPVTVDT
ncbi:MAG: hypothetical protein II877_07030, partial [Synergistaceae bacterium]|nr:hypothetical protein [Synergistaceae bacterium]